MLYVRQDLFEHGLCNFCEPDWKGRTSLVMDFMRRLIKKVDTATSGGARNYRVAKGTWLDFCGNHGTPQLGPMSPHTANAYWSLFANLAMSRTLPTAARPGGTNSLDARLIGLFLLLQPYTRWKQQLDRVSNADSGYNEGASPRAMVSPRFSPRGSAREHLLPGQGGAGGAGGLPGVAQMPPEKLRLYVVKTMLPAVVKELFTAGNDSKNDTAPTGFKLELKLQEILAVLLGSLSTDSSVAGVDNIMDVLLDIARASPTADAFLAKIEKELEAKCEQLYPPWTQTLTSDPVMASVIKANQKMNESLASLNLKEALAGERAMETQARATAVFANLTRTTVIDAKTYQRVYLVNCKGAHIYLCGADAPLGYVYISGCVDCQVVIEHAEVVTALGAVDCRFHINADIVKLDNCISSDAYLATTNAPILCGDSRSIKLAPYNVLSYDAQLRPGGDRDPQQKCLFGRESKLQEQNYGSSRSTTSASSSSTDSMAMDLATKWALPIVMTRSVARETESLYTFVNPQHFVPLVVPGVSPTMDLAQQMQGGGSGADPPWAKYLHLPEAYSSALRNRMAEVEQRRLTFDQRQMDKLQEEFAKFIETKGGKKRSQLHQLAKLQQSYHAFAQKAAEVTN
eukprot:g14139.t1